MCEECGCIKTFMIRSVDSCKLHSKSIVNVVVQVSINLVLVDKFAKGGCLSSPIAHLDLKPKNVVHLEKGIKLPIGRH